MCLNRAYQCLKAGARFSEKARMPSFWFSVANSEWKMRRSKRPFGERGLIGAMDGLLAA
jgi:hypothetical protein